MIRALMAAGVLALSCLPAHAGLIFRWENIGPGNRVNSAFGQIEFADGIALGSNIQYRWGGNDGGRPEDCPASDPPCQADPASPVVRFAFAPTEELESVGPIIPGILVDVRPPTSFGFNRAAFYNLEVNVRITPFGELIGLSSNGLSDLAGHNGVSDVRLEYVEGSVWRMTRFGSDAGNLCFSNDPPCSGITGRWVLQVGKVPEPGSLLLLAVGLTGLVLQRRR